MIRRIHWSNAALDLDNVLQDINDHNTHNPKHKLNAPSATIYRAFKILQCVRVVEFGPLTKNIGTPMVDKLISSYITKLESKKWDQLDNLLDSNSLNSVLWLVTHLRHELELSRTETRHPDYSKEHDLTVQYQ